MTVILNYKHFLIWYIVFHCTAHAGLAQRYLGFKAGPVLAGVSYSPFNADYITENEWGSCYALVLHQPLSPTVSVEVSPGLLKRNHTRRRRDPYQTIFHRYELSYLQLPVTIQVNKNIDPLLVYLETGMSVGYRFGAKETGVVPDAFSGETGANGNTETIRLISYSNKLGHDAGLHKFDFAVLAGAGARYQLSRRAGISIGGIYSRSVIQRTRSGYSGDNNGYHHHVGVQIGLLYFP